MVYIIDSICAEGRIEETGVCARVIAASEEGTVWKGVLFIDKLVEVRKSTIYMVVISHPQHGHTAALPSSPRLRSNTVKGLPPSREGKIRHQCVNHALASNGDRLLVTSVEGWSRENVSRRCNALASLRTKRLAPSFVFLV